MAAAAGRRAFAGTEPKLGVSGKFEGEFAIQHDAPFLQRRLETWARLRDKSDKHTESHVRRAIRIELPDGKLVEGTAFETTAMQVAEGISKGLAAAAMAAKVIYREPVASLAQCVAADGEEEQAPPGLGPEGPAAGEGEQQEEAAVLWDLLRPLEGSCRLELLKFEHPQGQDVFWHSGAHILGQAMERHFGCHLTIGPALESGFYYDGYFGDRKLKEEDLAAIEGLCLDICKEQQPFERCVLTKQDALELFADNPFKVQLISEKVPDGAMTSCYRCGTLVDLCRGPHLPSSARIKTFMVTKNSAAYWLGDQALDSLQRLYAIAFPDEKRMKDYKKFQEEAAKRDHRNVARQQELFFFHPQFSPGCCFWFPSGAKIYNNLLEFMRNEYILRGFTEVITPNMYSAALFKVSGHYQNYKEDMYSLDIESQEWMLKPMNCPGHFVMFDQRVRSYKELPIRFADFGVLHRNEASGALSGLTRVRRFQQDDGHIFVRPDQIKAEVLAGLDFLSYVYGVFGFKASYALSTRPKKALGTKEMWCSAEAQLKSALNESGLEWSLNPGDGAFYGPKIDIRLTDATMRKHQCGTIQLDFNNPIRFNLQYRREGAEEEAEAADAAAAAAPDFQGAEETDSKGEVIWREVRLKHGFERPVVIHRAILGSVERFTAVITEHFAGKWPFWISPRQVMVVPVSEKFDAYAQYVQRQFVLHKFCSETDVSSKTLNKKIREAQLAQWNYICVVGEKEQTSLTVNVRRRDVEKPLGAVSIGDFIAARNVEEGMPSSKPLHQLEAFEDPCAK